MKIRLQEGLRDITGGAEDREGRADKKNEGESALCIENEGKSTLWKADCRED